LSRQNEKFLMAETQERLAHLEQALQVIAAEAKARKGTGTD